METNLSCGEISPHERCGDKSELSQFMLFCRKISFVAIYTVLLRNIFGCDLRAFAWRKIEPKILSVEKKDKYEVCLWPAVGLTPRLIASLGAVSDIDGPTTQH